MSLLALAASGCGRNESGPEAVSAGDGKITSSDGNGNTTTINSGRNGGFSIKGADGSEVKFDKKGLRSDDGKGNSFAVGSVSVSEVELGVPFFPRSSATEHDIRAKKDGKDVFISLRSTTEAPDKVAKFYMERVRSPKLVAMETSSTLSGKLKDGRTLSVVAKASSSGTLIELTVK